MLHSRELVQGAVAPQANAGSSASVGSLCLRVHPNLLPLKKWLNTSTTLENKSNVTRDFLWPPSRKLIAILPNMKGLGIYRYKDLKQYVSKEFIGPTPWPESGADCWFPANFWSTNHYEVVCFDEDTIITVRIILIMQSTWVSH